MSIFPTLEIGAKILINCYIGETKILARPNTDTNEHPGEDLVSLFGMNRTLVVDLESEAVIS